MDLIFPLVVLDPQVPHERCGEAQEDGAHIMGLHHSRRIQILETTPPPLYKELNLLYLCLEGDVIFIILVRKQICPLPQRKIGSLSFNVDRYTVTLENDSLEQKLLRNTEKQRIVSRQKSYYVGGPLG